MRMNVKDVSIYEGNDNRGMKNISCNKGKSENVCKDEGAFKKFLHLTSSFNLAGCLASNIAKYILPAITTFICEKSGINWLLKFYGLAVQPINTIGEKRKLEQVELNEEATQGMDKLAKKVKHDSSDVIIHPEFSKTVYQEINIKSQNNKININVGFGNTKDDVNLSDEIIIKGEINAENSVTENTNDVFLNSSEVTDHILSIVDNIIQDALFSDDKHDDSYSNENNTNEVSGSGTTNSNDVDASDTITSNDDVVSFQNIKSEDDNVPNISVSGVENADKDVLIENTDEDLVNYEFDKIFNDLDVHEHIDNYDDLVSYDSIENEGIKDEDVFVKNVKEIISDDTPRNVSFDTVIITKKVTNLEITKNDVLSSNNENIKSDIKHDNITNEVFCFGEAKNDDSMSVKVECDKTNDILIHAPVPVIKSDDVVQPNMEEFNNSSVLTKNDVLFSHEVQNNYDFLGSLEITKKSDDDDQVPDENMNSSSVNNENLNMEQENISPSKTVEVRSYSYRNEFKPNKITTIIEDAEDNVDPIIEKKKLTSVSSLRNKSKIPILTPKLNPVKDSVFKFNGGKSTGSNANREAESEEKQPDLSLMTFKEKRVYFAKMIKDKEAAASMRTVKKRRFTLS